MTELPPRKKQLKFKQNKPFFNRTYLKYLGFVVAIAIVLLSEKSATSLDQPQLLVESNSQLRVLNVDDLQQPRLLLSFLTNPALTASAKIERNLAYQALRNAATKLPQIQTVLWTYDRLEIEFRWPAGAYQTSDTSHEKLLSLKQSLVLLQEQAINNITEKKRKLIKAEHYLQSKIAESALLANFSNKISGLYQNSTDLSRAFQASPSALLITHEESTEQFINSIDQQLAAISSLKAADFPTINKWQPGSASITARSKLYKLLIGSELAKVSNQNSRLELLSNFVISELLNAQNVSFRLIRQPIFNHGYQVIIFSSDKQVSTQSIELLKQHLQQLDLDPILIKVKDKLLNSYRSLVQNQERLFKLYSKKQFYQLNTESDSEYEAQLDTITVEQIRAQINKLLGEQIISIRLQPK